jgi:ribosome-associated protein
LEALETMIVVGRLDRDGAVWRRLETESWSAKTDHARLAGAGRLPGEEGVHEPIGSRCETCDLLRANHEGGLLATLTRTRRTPLPIADSRERAVAAARVAAENKGRDILVLDMRDLTPIYDYLIITTGASRRLMHTIAEEVDAHLTDMGDQRIGLEGYESSKWIVQDYGDIVLHVFSPSSREFYALEELWIDAPRVDWERE